MKILIVSEMSTPYAIGGGEQRYALLARQLVRMGHDVTWLSMRQRDCTDDETIDGIRHIHRGPRIAEPPARPLLAMIRFTFTVFFHLMRNRYDVVDVQTYAPLAPTWLACKLRHMPIVATIHDVSRSGSGQWMSDRGRQIVSLVETVLYRLPYDRIVSVSESTTSALVGRWHVPGERVRTVPNGIDLSRIPAADDSDRDIDIVFAGRIVPTKNIDELLEAIATVRESRPDLTATIIGDGPLLPTMRERATALGLDGCVTFAGAVDNDAVLGTTRRSKLFLHASSREGFPVVLVEAMASGAVVVGHRIPGIVDVVEDGRTGTLIDEHDIQAMAARTVELLNDDDRRMAMAAAGRSTVESRLTAVHMATAVEAVYHELA